MSPLEIRQLIADYYDAFNRGDREGMLALLHEEVAHDINQSEREVGKQAFRNFLGRMEHCYGERLRDIVIMVSEDGRRAAAEYTVRGEYRADDPSIGQVAGLPRARGQRYSLPGGAFFEIRDGCIARVTNYYNLQDWLRQVEEA